MSGVRRAIALATVLLSVAVAPAATRADDTARDVTAVADAIAAGNKTYVTALQTKNARLFGSLFADDAIEMPPFSAVVHGRPAIEAGIAETFRRVTFGTCELRTTETHLSGDSAFEIGTYKIPLVSDGYPSTLAGRYLVIWRRIAGVWKIAAETSQADPAPEPTPVPSYEAIVGPVPLPHVVTPGPR